MFQIIVCEDDAALRHIIVKHLTDHGYHCFEAPNGDVALTLFESQRVDLVITDIMMPVVDGYQLTKKIRSFSDEIPILMLSALDSIDDKEQGFIQGVDDYLVKPIEIKELLFRVKALLRRYQAVSENKIELSHTLLDYVSKTCYVDGKPVELTTKEFLVLFKLLSQPNKIFTREQIMNDIWGYDTESFDRTVDTHIKRIRERVIQKDFEIITVRGLGYKGVIK